MTLIGVAMKHLTDEQLETSAEQVRARELNSLFEMLQHLKEIDRRRLYSKRGFKSLHDYSIKRFRYSADEAHRRVCATRLLKGIPPQSLSIIEDKISEGLLQLTHLTEAYSYFRKNL